VDSRERLRRCYYHEELDRPAVYSRTGYPADDPSYDRLKAYLAAHSELKVHWRGPSQEPQFPLIVYTEPVSRDFERRWTVLHTPAGQFRASRTISLKGHPGLPETYLLKTRADVERYLSLPLPACRRDVSSFFELDRQVGRRGIVDVGLGTNPAGAVAVLLGSETFALMSITDRDLVHALCERQMRITLDRVRHLLSEGVGPYFSMAGHEYITPPLHGPRDFDDFNVRYDSPIIDLIHNAGGRVHIHCHGGLRLVFQSFVDMGCDVLHPVEPPPMGDLPAAEAKEMARGKMCIEGNIQIASMYEHTPDEIRAETRALIADAFDDRRGLIVSPTASPYIRGAGEDCFEMYRAMVDTVLAYSA
jgi:hypothetical protein